jgi:hypothetical protein
MSHYAVQRGKIFVMRTSDKTEANKERDYQREQFGDAQVVKVDIVTNRCGKPLSR